jgi:hypothetical protein
MELTWKASEPASALYAANCLSAGLPVADARLAAAFAPGVEMVLAEFDACQAPTDRLLPILTGLAARGVDDNRQLVEQAITKLFGSRSPLSSSAGRLAGAIGGLKAAFHQAYRGTTGDDSRSLADELLLRGRPLVEQWETRGPGMLLAIARSTEENVLVQAAEIALAYPIVGGNGMAHRSLNAVTIEAVLANPFAELPEVVRLAWLLAQLNLDLPMYADHVSAPHRDALGQWALVPAVLAAAEYVELAPLTDGAIGRTLTAWRLVAADTTSDILAAQSATLLTWWQTYQAGQTPWAVALGALEQMLFPAVDQS